MPILIHKTFLRLPLIVGCFIVITSSQCYRNLTTSPDTPEALWEGKFMEVTLRSGEKVTIHFVNFSSDSLMGLSGLNRSPMAIANLDIVSIRNKAAESESGTVLVFATAIVATTLMIQRLFKRHHHHHEICGLFATNCGL